MNSGTAKVNIDLTGITPTSELENGEFYFLFPRFTSSNGESYSIIGLSKIKIEDGDTGIEPNGEANIKVFPNPAETELHVYFGNHANYNVSIYNLQGVLLINKNELYQMHY
ncbi:T9SS type A sorting domain-containing protein [Saccharicrinis aurantiacus]|uniref:T9SS type A sorting domain-containing protein n=1 Tax=Saccharicrinis aurantiacus TaxID=1849719 RepID=UPI002491A7D3|nr:T9SS type A sorting domain-containing protein [Saccharicrinis aurantiacus]